MDEVYSIINGVPLKVLPGFRIYALAPERLIKTGNLGRGRIILMKYPTGDVELHYLTPNTTGNPKVTDLHYEYYQSLVIKAIHWVAKREPDIYIKELSLTKPRIDYKDVSSQKINLGLVSDRKAECQMSISLIIRDSRNKIEHEESRNFNIKSPYKASPRSPSQNSQKLRQTNFRFHPMPFILQPHPLNLFVSFTDIRTMQNNIPRSQITKRRIPQPRYTINRSQFKGCQFIAELSTNSVSLKPL